MWGSELIGKALGYAGKISRASQDIRVNNAQKLIAERKTVMSSSQAIGGGESKYVFGSAEGSVEADAMLRAAREGFTADSYLQGAKQVANDRKASIVAAQRAAGEKSEWLAKDGHLQRAASLFYEGETGKLSKMRIAGVGVGVGGVGYGIFGGDDRKRY